VRIGDREVATTEDVTAAVEESKVGDTVPVAVVRGGEEQTLQVRLTARPDLPAPLPSDP
jgi:S1-C subfamily serine protease